MCGLQAGASGDASAWLPVAAALKLDQAEFERRVVAVLPRIVRRNLDRAPAERIAQLLQAMHVDARVLPDDPQLAYIDRAGAICGPLPQSSLGDFIQPGESYRLRGDAAWRPWPVEREPAASAVLTVEFDDTPPSPAPGDEPPDDRPNAETTNEPDHAPADDLAAGTDDASLQPLPAPPPSDDGGDVAATALDDLPTHADDEPRRAMPPPLPAARTTPPEPPSAAPGDPATDSPARDADEATLDEDLVDPPAASSPPAAPDAAIAPEAAATMAPRRSRAGRLVVLLVLVALAAWAYLHWMADTHEDGSPTAATVVQPADPATRQAAAPAPATSADGSTSTAAAASSARQPAGAGTTLPARSAPAATPSTAKSATQPQ